MVVKIEFPRRKDGYVLAVGDQKTTQVFRCDTCETGMVLTLAHTWKDGKLVLYYYVC